MQNENIGRLLLDHRVGSLAVRELMARLSLVGFHYNGIVAVETVVKDQMRPVGHCIEHPFNCRGQPIVSAACLQVALRSNAFNISLVGIFQADPDEHDATMAYDRYLLVLPLQEFKNTCDHQM